MTQVTESMVSAGSMPSADELWEQLAAGDPRMRLVAEFVKRQEHQRAQPAADDDRWRRRAESLRETNRALREWNEVLASALGACGACWGGDADCPACGGAGDPGACDPDEELYRRFVVPAVNRRRQYTPLPGAPGVAPAM